jgi:hypothetical protein
VEGLPAREGLFYIPFGRTSKIPALPDVPQQNSRKEAVSFCKAFFPVAAN